jgi:hypothetical protein
MEFPGAGGIKDKGLCYVQQPNEVDFYFNDVLLFKSSKNLPFLVVKIKKDDIIKEIALYENNINKEKNNRFKIVFFNGRYSVECFVTQENNTVSFEIYNKNGYYETDITLYKENSQKVYGLSTYKEKTVKLSFLKKITAKIKGIKQIHVKPHKKLSFYLLEKYFFENKNIFDYDIDVKDNIYIKIRQDKIFFNLVFSSNINVAINQNNKNCERIKKFFRPHSYLRCDSFDAALINLYQKKYDVFIDGVILDAGVFVLGKEKINGVLAKNSKKELLYAFDGEVENKAAYPYYDDSELINVNGKLKIDFDSDEACRKYKNTLRKFLDMNIDGVYIDGQFNAKEMLTVHKIVLDLIKSEYPQCIVFHSAISENNDDFGYFIIKNNELSENFEKFGSYYLYSGENRIGMETTDILRKNDGYKFPVKIYDLREKSRKKA